MRSSRSSNSRSLAAALKGDLRSDRPKCRMLEDAFCFRRFVLSTSVVLGALWTPAFTASSYAGAVTWNGGTGKWSDANWTPGFPGAADDVTLSVGTEAGKVTLDVDATINELTLKPKNMLLLTKSPNPKTLTVTTSVTNNSKTTEGITIDNGNSMVVGDLKNKTGDINNNGNFAIRGSNLTVGRNLNSSGAISVSRSGLGLSTVQVGGNLNSSGTFTVRGGSTVTVGRKLTNEIGEKVGKLAISDGSSVTAGELVVDQVNAFMPEVGLDLSNSTFMVRGRAVNEGADVIQVGNRIGNAKLTVGGRFTNEGSLTVGPPAGSSAANSVTVGKGFKNSSVVIVNQASPAGGELSVTTGNYTQTAGSTTILGTLTVKAGKYIQDDGDTIVGSPKMPGLPAIKGNLTAKDGVILNGGKLQGSGGVTGGIDDKGGEVIAGFKEPAAGTLTITGNYEQETAGTLNTLFQGTTPGDWSVLEISGKAALAGTLDVSLINGFAFNASQIGDVFDIMDFAPGELTGAFSTLELNDVTTPGSTPTMLNIGDNLALLVGYNDDDVTLTLKASIAPVPLPTLSPVSSLALLVVGLAGLDLIRRWPVG